MSASYFGSPQSGPPPPVPPPKPHSQAPSRSETPVTPPVPRESRPQHYSEQPPLSSHPPQSQVISTAHQHSQQQYGESAQYSGYAQSYSTGPPLPQTFDLPDSIVKHTTTDLSNLLSDPKLMKSLAEQHPAYLSAIQSLQNQIEANKSLATQVSRLEAQVKSMREQSGQLMLQHTSLQTQWRRKQTEMDEALAPWGPRAMYQRLLGGISEQEAMLTALQESFVDGGGKATEKEVTDWVKRLREGTVVLEKRRETRARWDEGRVGGWR